MSALPIGQWNAKAAEIRKSLKQVWAKLCEKDGNLFSKRLLELLRAVGYVRMTGRPANQIALRATDMDVHFALISMGLSEYHIHDGVYLRYQTVEHWYLEQTLGERGDLRNVLLCRNAIGIPRFGYHRMPPPDTYYGEVTLNNGVKIWDLMHNKFAKKCEQGIGAMKPQYFPENAAHPRPSRYRPASAFSAASVFGAASQRPTPIEDLINNKFAVEFGPGTELAPERTYAPDEFRQVAGKLPTPRPTRSSAGVAEANTARFGGLDIQGHAMLHATPVQRSARPRPNTARL